MAITPRTFVKNPLLLVLTLALAAVPFYMMMNCSKRSCHKQTKQVRRVVVQQPPTLTAAPTASAGFLGIGIETVDKKLATARNLKVNQGVLVTKVMKGYAAKTSGFRTNDVVLTVNGKAVKTKCELKAMISSRRAGAPVAVLVNRKGTNVKLYPTLSPSPLKNNSCAPTKTKRNCRMPKK